MPGFSPVAADAVGSVPQTTTSLALSQASAATAARALTATFPGQVGLNGATATSAARSLSSLQGIALLGARGTALSGLLAPAASKGLFGTTGSCTAGQIIAFGLTPNGDRTLTNSFVRVRLLGAYPPSVH